MSFHSILIHSSNASLQPDLEKYIISGSQGGHKAAHDIKTAVQQYLDGVSSGLSNLPCIVKIYANIDGLRNALFQAGLNEHANKLKDFARGFSQVGGSSAFIDVGGSKEQADYEIKG